MKNVMLGLVGCWGWVFCVGKARMELSIMALCISGIFYSPCETEKLFIVLFLGFDKLCQVY